MKNGKNKTKAEAAPLPVHSLESNKIPVYVRDIRYSNPYDFTKEHRHDYFEILFFENGGGLQLIDFLELPVLHHSCYIIFPRQIHLLRRAPEAFGTLVQFTEENIPSARVKNLLQQVSFDAVNPSVIYENNPEKQQLLAPALQVLKTATESNSNLSQEITLHYLQALLLMLVESREQASAGKLSEEEVLLLRFQQLLDEQFHQEHTVQHYVALTSATEKKLAAATKKFLGLSPLQVIHNRLILEAKRILLFEDSSHKEIAFRLGFDSPASFSQFVKNKTGLTPSALHSHLVEIHK